MKTCIISPYSRPTVQDSKPSPKNYPYWEALVAELKKMKVSCIQVGLEGEPQIKGVSSFIKDLNFPSLIALLGEADFWISGDNFFQHFAHYYKKRGLVIFALSDPLIFGWAENVNLLKDRKYLRQGQFDFWYSTLYNDEAFVDAKTVIKAVKKNFL